MLKKNKVQPRNRIKKKKLKLRLKSIQKEQKNESNNIKKGFEIRPFQPIWSACQWCDGVVCVSAHKMSSKCNQIGNGFKYWSQTISV